MELFNKRLINQLLIFVDNGWIIQISLTLESQTGQLLLVGNGCLVYLRVEKDSEVVST